MRSGRPAHVHRAAGILAVPVVGVLLLALVLKGSALWSVISERPTATPSSVSVLVTPPGGRADPATAVTTPGAVAPDGTTSRADGNDATATADACPVPNTRPVVDVPRGFVASGSALVVASAVNLRAGPSITCPIVGSLGFGMRVDIRSGLLKHDQDNWRWVSTPSGDGYTIAGVYQKDPVTQPPFVPVLMYHHIAAGDDDLHVPPDVFEQQLAWLRDHDYVSITPDDLFKALYRGLALPENPVMLTIDDGDPSAMTFKSLLHRYGYRGVYFLPNYAEQTPAQIQELDRSGKVCGHTASHPYLNQLSYADQGWQITDNQRWLEGIVGHPVRCFAYPFGASDTNTEAVLRAADFTIAFDATGGVCPRSANVDQYHIRRKEIDPVFDIATFARIVTQDW